MRFKRSEGLTASERVLAGLCDLSFLKLWTYPNLYKKPAKELADLLVVFGNEVMLFSDKSCACANSGNTDLDWSRWYRRAINASAHQLSQAERWLRTYPDEVYLDAKCTVPLPVCMPTPAAMRVHRICVATGAADQALAITGKRSLTVRPATPNDAEPFTVGSISAARGWVHVFDEANLEAVLTELSTVADFVHYLVAKETLLGSERFMFAEAETDIMA